MVLTRYFEPPDLVEVGLAGVITADDQRDILAFTRAAISSAGLVRVLVTLEEFGGWAAIPANGRDNVWLRDDEGVARMAIVGRAAWKAMVLTMLAQPVRRMPIAYFEHEADARAWLASPSLPHIQSA